MKLIEEIDIGGHVECDLCSVDYTTSDAEGGFLFIGKGVCPACAPGFEADVRKYGEEEFIKDRARPGEKFREAALRWRGGDNKVRFYSGAPR